MDFFVKLWGKLKRPKGWTLALAYILTAVFVTAALLMLLVGYEASALAIVAYFSFACAAITFGYSVYTVVIYAPGLKGRISDFLERGEFTRRLVHNWGYRTVVTASLSLLMSTAYAVFNGVLGITSRSIWYGALAAYYICLAAMRGGLLAHHSKRGYDEDAALIRAKNYFKCGIVLLILNAALSSAIAQMIFDDRGFEYKDWIIYAFAAYAFFKITMSIFNAIKAGKQENLTIRAIREINLVDGAVSILALQTALLHTFATGEVDISLFNTLTGSAVSIFSVGLSIYMIVKGRDYYKLTKENEIKEKETDAGK